MHEDDLARCDSSSEAPLKPHFASTLVGVADSCDQRAARRHVSAARAMMATAAV
ncbi:hypothetical protein ABGB16_02645 [Micromonospora sp. B11E3]|uniref:hypothetical protein n=1 Tax=Micromonospora sp. B11E3 TaxID=3153562 RepID=UPI00325DF6A7